MWIVMAVPRSTNNSAPAGRLVISFDLGTTQSAVAVAYLRLGIHERFTTHRHLFFSLTSLRYLGQPDLVDVVDKWDEHKMYLGRVPTAVLYDDKGTVSIPSLGSAQLRILIFTPHQFAGEQLLGCGAEAIALAEQEENRGAARTWPEHFKMQLHPNRDLPTKRGYFRRNSGSH